MASATYLILGPPTVASVSPASATSGAPIQIAGSGFGRSQARRSVWLGTTYGKVLSWNDTRIIAMATPNSRGGIARVQVAGVWSNALPFDILPRAIRPRNSANRQPHIARVRRNTGADEKLAILIGSSFGSHQEDSRVLLDGVTAPVLNWSDQQVIVALPVGASNGSLRIQRSGQWSNTVSAAGYPQDIDAVTITPDLLSMAVGETRTVQALGEDGQPATGLIWTSSDSTVVSLSSDDPPVLTAMAGGHATVTAGGSAVDVTVLADALPAGTVIWSNPGNGSGVYGILPAIPGPNGVADVFAFQGDGTIQAITIDGVTAWTADVTEAWNVLPDFQGGVSLGNRYSIWRLNEHSGQPSARYTTPGTAHLGDFMIVHPDATIFADEYDEDNYGAWLVGITPAGGAEKVRVFLGQENLPPPPLDCSGGSTDFRGMGRLLGLIAGGDGYTYAAYQYPEYFLDCELSFPYLKTIHLMLLRISSDGSYDNIHIRDWSPNAPWFSTWYEPQFQSHIISNADTGVLVTWELGAYDIPRRPSGTSQLRSASGAQALPIWTAIMPPNPLSPPEFGMATTSGAGVTASYGSIAPNQTSAIWPLLQAENGSFVGTVSSGDTNKMISFDQTGSIAWNVTGNYLPQIATADGGVIATDYDSGSVIIFDQNGTITGQMDSVPVQSWTGNTYQYGSVEQIVADPLPIAMSLWAVFGGNRSGNGAAARLWDFKLVWQNNCSPNVAPCGFTLYPDNPQYLGNLAINATSQAMAIKSAALAAFRQAYRKYPVNIREGAPDTGDHRVRVIDGSDLNSPCGRTTNAPTVTVSEVFYRASMEQAQWAIPILMSTAQDVQTALGRADLTKAIGAGIGNNAAHELAHQFLLRRSGMDDNSTNTYNGRDCNGDTARWVFGIGPINWEDTTEQALRTALGYGWHK